MTSDGTFSAGTARLASPEHLPMRPLWLCRVCGQPWPCGRARLVLVTEYRDDPMSLFLYLAGLLHEAIDDLYQLNPSSTGAVRELFDRFLGWPARRHGVTGPTTQG
ncbi:hypothetical protein [Plantactinospora sp. KBS50]|uniref:hypothetical protein n=1 Tax=Plantactinospora sp. KBS50 TaxID=2024580 RepID=UPI000BAB1169|nr:hypothetical protein [Plantactinospora sp. KBS50]ASW53881.1 hypothetical protein CIK06_06285 [Plantactinospora sp. KBS50]